MFEKLKSIFREKDFSVSIQEILNDVSTSIYRNSYSHADFLRLCSNTYNKNSNVNRSISKFAQLTSTLPIKFSKITKDGYEEIDIPKEIYHIFSMPNERDNYTEFIKNLIVDYFIAGEFFILKDYGTKTLREPVPIKKDIKSLHRIQPNNVKSVVMRQGKVLQFSTYRLFSNFETEETIDFSKVENKDLVDDPFNFNSGYLNGYPTNNMIQFKNQNPIRSDRGLSFVILLLDDIDIISQGKVWNRSMLENFCTPSGILYFPANTIGANVTSSREKAIKKGSRDAMEDKIKYKFAGARNAKKLMFLEGGLKYEKVGENARDMDYLQGQSFSKEEIARCIGIPSQLLNLEKSSNYNNYVEAKKQFYVDTAIPFYNQILSTLCYQLIYPHYSNLRDIKIEVDQNKIPVIAEEIYIKFKEIKDIEFLTINEKRNLVGYNKIEEENADKILISQGKVSLDEVSFDSLDIEESEDEDEV